MHILVLLFILIGFIVRAFTMRDVSFFDWDEGIYAEVASELIETGSLQTTFNGQVWFNKPPISHYLISFFMRYIPDPELAARLVMVIFGSLLIILTYVLSKKVNMHFFAKQIKKLNKFEQKAVHLIAPVSLASAPIIIERSVQLNTDVMLGVFWLLYFIYIDSYRIKLISVTLGSWSKSLLGLYPLGFEFLMLKKSSFNINSLIKGLGLLIVPLSWHMINYVAYGDFFIQSHLMDQLLKRVTDPIELHYGGKLFYTVLAWENFSILFVLMIIGYAWFALKTLNVMKNKFDLQAYVKQIKKIWQSKDWPMYLTLYSAVPFFVFLTFVQSKITWYFATVAPLFTLILPFVYVQLPRKVRYVFLGMIAAIFMYNFIPKTYALTIESATPPDNIRVAKCVADRDEGSVSMLVNAQERQNRNVLEAAQQQTQTSFIYGGSPSFVYYTQKPVNYYYKPEEFMEDIAAHDILVFSEDDRTSDTLASVSAELDAMQPLDVCSFGEWKVLVQ